MYKIQPYKPRTAGILLPELDSFLVTSKLSVLLMEQHDMKAYRALDVYLHALLSAIDGSK
jgi:hypothetical protein